MKPGNDKSWWKNPIGLILLISLSIHLLLLLVFGGKVLFQGVKGGVVFQSDSLSLEKAVEPDIPTTEELHQEMSDDEAPPAEVGPPQEAVNAEAVVKLPGESGWAPPVRGEGRVPVAGFSGKGKAAGRGKQELFGTVVGNKKLGVIVDVSGSMQPYLEGVMEEVLENFPDAEVVLVNGCGMEEVGPETSERGPRPRPPGRKKGPRRVDVDTPMILPHVVGLASSEGLSSPAVGGWGGVRQTFPEIFEILSRRSATWIVVGDGAESGARQAIEHLAGDRVQAIYWFSDFEDPVERQEGEKAAEAVRGNKIEVFLHPMSRLNNIRDWSEKVGAKVIQANVKRS